MRTTREIYEHYRIPPWLQTHQLRVAAVGKMVADSLASPIDTDLVVTTCLLHDIGAIVKFDFTFSNHSTLKDLCPPEDVAHWKQVQEEMQARYGMKEYVATDAIIDELGREDVRRIFNNMGMSNMEQLIEGGVTEACVAQYADMRAGPYGIVSISERVADVTKRYQAFWEREGRGEESKRYVELSAGLERRLFVSVRISPEDINDASAVPLIEALWDYEIVQG